MNFMRELAAYLEALEKVKLEDWTLSSVSLDELRQQYKKVFLLTESFADKAELNVEKLKVITDERLEKAGASLFKEYQEQLLEELKGLIGFPVFANSDRIMTKDEIADLEESLDLIMENLAEFKSEMEPMEVENFDLMYGSVKKISNFAKLYLNPSMARETVVVNLPTIEDLDAGNVNNTILWRARFVEFVGHSKQMRMGKISEELGEISLDEEEITLEFTSTVGGSDGDVGRVNISGGWVPLQLLLRDDSKVNPAGKNKYVYTDRNWCAVVQAAYVRLIVRDA